MRHPRSHSDPSGLISADYGSSVAPARCALNSGIYLLICSVDDCLRRVPAEAGAVFLRDIRRSVLLSLSTCEVEATYSRSGIRASFRMIEEMMRTTLKFHGTVAEIEYWMREWSREHELLVVAEWFFPDYEVRLIEMDEPGGIGWVEGEDPPDRLSLHIGAVDVQVNTPMEFIGRNPEGLTIVLGSQTEKGLRESLLGAMSDNDSAMKTWKSVRNSAKKSMKSGAWIVKSISGERLRDNAHLYTKGARDLQTRGIPSLGPGDWIRYELD